MNPYRTGALLTWDVIHPGCDPDHFRVGTDIGLRASGSRQLDIADYKTRLHDIRQLCPEGKDILVVDLRQESHLYFDQRAVSWYADRDWSNVRRSLDWVLADESAKQQAAARFGEDEIFWLAHDANDSISIQYQKILKIEQARSEEQELVDIDTRLRYVRVPVSDHCRPEADAMGLFFQAIAGRANLDWVHFHCHGGDGRTTSFLALYDMVCWRDAHPHSPLPPMEVFNSRQLMLFNYDLRPCQQTGWKYPFALARWDCLDDYRKRISRGEFDAPVPDSVASANG